MFPKNSDLGLKKPATVKYLPRGLKYPAAGSRLWKLHKLQGSHILHCWYQVLPGRINGQSTSQGQSQGPQKIVNEHLLSSEQDHSLTKESTPPPELSLPARWIPHCCGPVPAWISQSTLFQIKVSTVVILFLVHTFYEYFWREMSSQLVFEFLRLWNKGTHYWVRRLHPGCGSWMELWWPEGSLCQKWLVIPWILTPCPKLDSCWNVCAPEPVIMTITPLNPGGHVTSCFLKRMWIELMYTMCPQSVSPSIS